MKYTIVFEHNGVKKRTVVDAETEYYARRKLIEKASGVVLIDSCTLVNEFKEAKNIMDFLRGFRQ